MIINYSTPLCFDSMLSYNTSVQNNDPLTTAKQNLKISYHFYLRLPPRPPSARLALNRSGKNDFLATRDLA